MYRLLTATDQRALLAAWHEQNDNGNGYAVNVWDDRTQDFEAAVHMDDITGDDGSGWKILATCDTLDRHPLLAMDDDHGERITLICDANGPWGCDVTSVAREILGF